MQLQPHFALKWQIANTRLENLNTISTRTLAINALKSLILSPPLQKIDEKELEKRKSVNSKSSTL